MPKWNVLVVLAALLSPVTAPAEDALRFGVVPQGAPVEVMAAWKPVADALSTALGRPVIVETEKDIPTFEACVLDGAYDISYMNPYHYVVASDAVGYRVIAHRANKGLSGLIVVAAESPYQTLEDLAGLRIAFPSPAAFAASILQRAELAAAGIDFTPIYTRSHSSAYLAVARGALPAGAGVNRTFATFTASQEEGADLRVIHRTQEYTPHAIAVSTRIDDETAETLADALQRLGTDMPEALAGLGIEAFARPAADAYEDVRSLAVTPEETGLNLQRNPACPSD